MTKSRVHPDCRNASNPYHECVEFCFLKIAESKERMKQPESDVKQGRRTIDDGPASSDYPNQAEDHESGREEHDNDDHLVEENLEVGYTNLTEWRKKLLLEFRLKTDEAIKGYQTAMVVAEKKRLKASTELRGVSKQKWTDERKKNIGKQMDANGLDMKKAYMLDTQDAAEKKYNNWEKIPAPFRWDEAAEKKYNNCEKIPAPFGWDDVKQGRATDGPDYPNRAEDHRVQESGREDHDNGDNDHLVVENVEVGYTQLTGWRKRLFELKMNEKRIADQTAMVAEKKRSEAPTESRGVSDSPASSDYPDQAEDHCVHESGREEHDNGDDDDDDDYTLEENVEDEARKVMVAEKKRSEAPTELRGISKQKWIDERTNKIGKVLDANGLDMKKAYMLDTQEAAGKKFKKWENKPAPIDSDVVNQKILYDSHNKHMKNIEYHVDGEYNKKKEADPESYSDASNLQYGKAPKISEDTIDKMVKELHDKDEKSKETDIDSINDRNEHFNKKIERSFGKYTLTLEIKNNLESGIDLQDYVGVGLFTLCIGVGVLNCIWGCRQ